MRGLSFTNVLARTGSVPVRTCELAGFEAVAEMDPDLVEWNYGDSEGGCTLRKSERSATAELLPATAAQEGNRQLRPLLADPHRVVSRIRAVPGNVLLFSSGHFIQGLANALDWT